MSSENKDNKDIIIKYINDLLVQQNIIKGKLLPKNTLFIESLKYLSYNNLLKIIQNFNMIDISGGISDQVEDLIFIIVDFCVNNDINVFIKGILENIDTYGFLRSLKHNFYNKPYDIYINNNTIKKYNLRNGDEVICQVKKGQSKTSKLLSGFNVISINDQNINIRRKLFKNLVPIFPQQQLVFERKDNNIIGRMIDLIAPMGLGQRSMILAQPKAGKTTVIRDMAKSIEQVKDIDLIVLLIGERPEEVTEMERSLTKAKVIASTFDEVPQRHTKVAEMTIARAKRLAELGRDVVLIVDSISRLARAYNFVCPSSGKVLSGGVEAASLYMIKKFFGSARNLENSGSITIIATCLIDTGSRMDEVLHEELKGTGNSELYLDRDLARSGKFPSINFSKSSTRRIDSFLQPNYVNQINMFNKVTATLNNEKVYDLIKRQIKNTDNNQMLLNTAATSTFTNRTSR